MSEKREVTAEAVETAIRIREDGGKWSDVIAATGFNGATLRPHMLRAGYDGSTQRLPSGDAAKGTPAMIRKDRENSVSWYAIGRYYGITEAEARRRYAAVKNDERWSDGRAYLSLKGTPKIGEAAKNGQGGRLALRYAEKLAYREDARREAAKVTA